MAAIWQGDRQGCYVAYSPDFMQQERCMAQAFSYLAAIPIEPRIPCYAGIAYMKKAKPAVQDFVRYICEHMDEISQAYPQ